MDPVVLRALQELTSRVNPTGELRPASDKSLTVSTFELLKVGGHPWDPAAVWLWATNSTKLNRETVAALYEFALRVAGGRRYNLDKGSRKVGPDALARWRSDDD